MLQHSVQNGPNWCISSCHKVTSDFFAMNTPDPPHWTLNSCFSVFHTIWMYLEPFGCLQNSVQNGPKWCKSSGHEVMSEFFANNTPDPPYWPLPHVSVRFVLFGCIWDSLLCYNTQFQMGKLVQKFVPRSRVGIFRNERTRSTPLDSKLMFWYRLVTLQNSV